MRSEADHYVEQKQGVSGRPAGMRLRVREMLRWSGGGG